MPDFNAYLTDTAAIPTAGRAVAAWNRIQDKPTSVTLKRLGTAQTVRIEYNNTVGERRSAAGEASVRGLTVFGVKDHPDAAVVDTDVRRGDRFVLDNAEYQVIGVIETIGEIQANCEVIG